jgi:hypothetical protein
MPSGMRRADVAAELADRLEDVPAPLWSPTSTGASSS